MSGGKHERSLSLNGTWQLHFGPQTTSSRALAAPDVPPGYTSIPATVPGNVELDLIAAGLLPRDLDYGDNIYRVLALEGHQWWFERRFHIAPLGGERPVLVFDGLDTIATIWLNGERVGTAANMLVPHEFEIDGLLRDGENSLVVAIDSAVLKGRETPAEPECYAHENNWESLTVRKAPSGYGWDIMPRVVSAGLWRDVRIEFRAPLRFSDVYLASLAVDPAARTARLLVHWNLDAPAGPLPVDRIRLRILDQAGGAVLHERTRNVLATSGELQEDLSNVEPWWPRGYGAPTLYSVELALLDTQGVQAEWQSLFGFRTIDLRNSEVVGADGDGEFQFVVNGVDIFCKGSNWVPLDALHSRDAAGLDDSLALLADLNCNMIRCWGGNVYEGQRFFDFCDREGVMVWQDFALACALYPQTADFHAQVRAEVEAIVPLLRNHPALVLWAGNNEIDQFYPRERPGIDPNQHDLISRVVIPTALRRLDPFRRYLPSSPYYGEKLWAVGDVQAAAEDHLWGPRDDFKGRYYRTAVARFASEIGYHGCPARSSLERMMRPGQLWPWQGSEDWLTHAVRPQPASTIYNYRIPLMANQIEVLFGEVPDQLDAFILASQISQAEALKYFIEMFRLEKGRRSGILWWNVKDGWPQISDAIVDYYGTRKLGYHIVKRLQQDVLVMLAEPECDRQRIIAVNETAADVSVDVDVSTRGAGIFHASRAIIPANGRLELGAIETAADLGLVEISWRGPRVTGSNHYLAGSRPFDLQQLIGIYRAILGDPCVDEQIAKHEGPPY